MQFFIKYEHPRDEQAQTHAEPPPGRRATVVVNIETKQTERRDETSEIATYRDAHLHEVSAALLAPVLSLGVRANDQRPTRETGGLRFICRSCCYCGRCCRDRSGCANARRECPESAKRDRFDAHAPAKLNRELRPETDSHLLLARLAHNLVPRTHPGVTMASPPLSPPPVVVCLPPHPRLIRGVHLLSPLRCCRCYPCFSVYLSRCFRSSFGLLRRCFSRYLRNYFRDGCCRCRCRRFVGVARADGGTIIVLRPRSGETAASVAATTAASISSCGPSSRIGGGTLASAATVGAESAAGGVERRIATFRGVTEHMTAKFCFVGGKGEESKILKVTGRGGPVGQ